MGFRRGLGEIPVVVGCGGLLKQWDKPDVENTLENGVGKIGNMDFPIKKGLLQVECEYSTLPFMVSG